MTKTKSTKRALLLSALSLLMCVSMLVGSTFAWFTDSATSNLNTIQAGTLDVAIKVGTDPQSLDADTLDFKYTTESGNYINRYWEPGATYETTPVYIHNLGNLALKYEIVINGIDGDAKLLEVIEWTLKIGDSEIDLATFEGHLAMNSCSEAVKLIGHMKETAGNEYQGLTLENISITVYATQDTVEADSYDNQYDADAMTQTILVDNEAALKAALAAGQNVKLANDITVNAEEVPVATGVLAGLYVPKTVVVNGKTVATNVTIDGNGYTLTVVGADDNTVDNQNCGIYAGDGITVKNLTIDGASRGIYIMNGDSVSKDLVMENVTIVNSARAFNITTNGGSMKVIATGCTFAGKISYAPVVTAANFADCDFVIGSGCKGNIIEHKNVATFDSACNFETGFEVEE